MGRRAINARLPTVNCSNMSPTPVNAAPVFQCLGLGLIGYLHVVMDPYSLDGNDACCRLHFRPPGTSVPDGLLFCPRCFISFFFIFSPCVLRDPSTDRRETLPHGRKLAEFYKPTLNLKYRGAPSPPPQMGPKTCEISVNFGPLQI